jgi:hypothetical protein
MWHPLEQRQTDQSEADHYHSRYPSGMKKPGGRFWDPPWERRPLAGTLNRGHDAPAQKGRRLMAVPFGWGIGSQPPGQLAFEFIRLAAGQALANVPLSTFRQWLVAMVDSALEDSFIKDTSDHFFRSIALPQFV